MTLEVFSTNQSASRGYENEFFDEMASYLSEVFRQRGYEGVLFGFPRTGLDKTLQPDALIVTQSVVLIVDFKNQASSDEIVFLPSDGDFEKREWRVEKIKQTTRASVRSVAGGSSTNVNPFVQLQKQSQKLSELITRNGIETVVATCVVFHDDPIIEGKIPGRYQGRFSVATRSNYHRVIDNALNVVPRNGQIEYKSMLDVFDVKPYGEVQKVNLDEIRAVETLRDEVAVHGEILHDIQSKLLTLHNVSETSTEKFPENSRQIEDISREEALVLKRYELANEAFLSARNASLEEFKTLHLVAKENAATARSQAVTERQRAKSTALEVKQAIEVDKNKTTRLAWIVVGGLLSLALIAIVLWPRAGSIAPAGGPCIPFERVADLQDQVACIEFTPQSSNTEYNTAYVNDLEKFKDGLFYLEIPNWSAIYENASEITSLEGNKIRVNGLVSLGDDGRFKIVVTSTSQIDR
jgi:hypothetical protein